MMKATLFGKGKITFQIFFVILFQCANFNCQFNLYNIDRSSSRLLEFDCLNYYVRQEKFAHEDLWDITDEIIPYCIRTEVSVEVVINPHSQKISFEELHLTNVTSKQLLSWLIPFEVVQQYDIYLNEQNNSSNGYIYNCTKPWFGVYCQYSFEYNELLDFNEIVEDAFYRRQAYFKSSDIIVQMPCYVHLNCRRDEKFWCLDWREVCDGHVDCFDDGIDEEFCFDMQINECKENEFRCYNGLCISADLWEDGSMDCLDGSDDIIREVDMQPCFKDPTFRCEEYSCILNFPTFACGDGECVEKFDECQNGRHISLFESMATQGNLSDKCWTALICLTEFPIEDNGRFCDVSLMRNLLYEWLNQCTTFFQFPTVPLYSNYVYFFYEKPYERVNWSEFYLPDYVCFNQHLCDFITPDFTYNNLGCIALTKLPLNSTITGNPWSEMMSKVAQYFDFCSTSHIISEAEIKYINHPSLYKCQNSSKLISKHRIMDGNIDCVSQDDESYKNSCQLNHSYRIKCLNQDGCWSPLLRMDVCRINNSICQIDIPFQKFCDGIREDFLDKYGEKHNDEFGCKKWCDNMYSRCDGYWSCSDGRDENNCMQTKCPSGTYACISPASYSVICVAHTQVNDETLIHCFGAADEQEQCRLLYPESPYRFRCSNDGPCIQPSDLCNGRDDCGYSDDDERFCNNTVGFTCDKHLERNRTEIEQLLCGLSEAENNKINYFSLHTSADYPALQYHPNNHLIHQPLKQDPFKNVHTSSLENILWPWHCNRGLPVRTWIDNNTYNISCLCPPSYYGHLCQYQNQRVSLTLKLTSSNRYVTYTVVSMLIDEQENIYAYDQYTYNTKQICSIKLNRYLLFPTRPKDITKNYSVRIDVFDKSIMKYLGSWYYPITFPFLPVNRLAVSLVLSNRRIETSSNCLVSCINGNCIKYLNDEKYFCRCHSNWSGIHCDILIKCETCLSQSICIGSSYNQSICVCPLHRFGSQCSLRLSTCPNNACLNNAQCIPGDISVPVSNYTCICPEEYFGPNCQYTKSRLDVSVIDISIPSYLVAYFFTLPMKSDPIDTIVLRKLTLFQHRVTFHLSIAYHLVIIQVNDKFYLAALQHTPKTFISTSIKPSQQCIPSIELFNSTILNMDQYQRIIYYYDLCRRRFDLKCFLDETYICLCTSEHHANCMKFHVKTDFQCKEENNCRNNGKCLQDHRTCPSTRICLCENCFYGNQCEFYARTLGLTLDEILAYEFKPNTNLIQQPLIIQISTALTIIIFLIGMANSIISIRVFRRKNSEAIGCRIYILASSITALIVMILFTLKFWFLFLSYQSQYSYRFQEIIIIINCKMIELLLKISLYVNNWFNACVAIERSTFVFYGILFNKNKSLNLAKILTIVLPMIVTCLFIPQILHLQIFHDQFEKRSWCVVKYSSLLQTYSLFIILFHYFLPLIINFLSALFLIKTTTHQKHLIQPDRTFWFHLKSRVKKYKHLILSPFIIIILTAPYLIIELVLDCNKSYAFLRFYLIGYFLSFIPSASMFIIYVIPSSFYV